MGEWACLRDPETCPLRSGIYCAIAGDDAAVRCCKLGDGKGEGDGR